MEWYYGDNCGGIQDETWVRNAIGEKHWAISVLGEERPESDQSATRERPESEARHGGGKLTGLGQARAVLDVG